jgi:hypothetical protein
MIVDTSIEPSGFRFDLESFSFSKYCVTIVSSGHNNATFIYIQRRGTTEGQ